MLTVDRHSPVSRQLSSSPVRRRSLRSRSLYSPTIPTIIRQVQFAADIPINSPLEMKLHRLRPLPRREHLYGAVQLLVSSETDGQQRSIGRFRLEPSAAPHLEPSLPSRSPVIVENPQEETRWYWRYYLGSEHQNFAGIDATSKTPFFMSILVEEDFRGERVCRAILWTAQGQRRLRIPVTSPSKILTAKAVLQQFPDMSDYNRSLKEIVNAELQRELVMLEDQEGGVNCKFGVIYALKTQSSDVQMFSNEHGDDNFERFIKLLGQRIELRDWGSYRGGLDTSSNSTGRESVYAVFEGYEIMFHVSTMLPYSRDNQQQIERKRHVGNDIVNIVFEAGGNPEYAHFSPTMIKSHFTHVFAVVTFDEAKECYRLWVYSEETVPAYGPALPRPNVFYDAQQFRKFLLTKLINAEKAAFRAKVFVEKRRSTMDAMIKDMYIEHMKEFNRAGIYKITDNVIQKLRSPVRKDKPKELTSFCKFGELVKLEKMLCGDISQTFKPIGICRKQPWQPELISENSVAWSVTNSDAWGSTAVLLVTDDSGVVFVTEGLSVPVIEANAHVQQLAVEEHFGLFLARIEQGKESSLIAFPLSDLRSAVQSGEFIRRERCLKHRIPITKGCHLFGTTDPNGLRLSVIVCTGKNLMLLRWNISSLAQYTEKPANAFTLIRTISLGEEATAVSVFELDRTDTSVRVVALCRTNLVIADFGRGLVDYIDWNVPKNPINALHGISEGETDEILLCHRNMTVAVDTTPDGIFAVKETFWSCPLKTFACRFPYIFGFGDDLIEVRLAVNGNLLCSMYMPHVKVLSTKDDIIFAADVNSSYNDASAKMPKNNNPVNETPKIRTGLNKCSSSKDKNQQQIRRWNIYRIIGMSRLQTDHKSCQSATSNFAPQLLNLRHSERLYGRNFAASSDDAGDSQSGNITGQHKQCFASNSSSLHASIPPSFATPPPSCHLPDSSSRTKQFF